MPGRSPALPGEPCLVVALCLHRPRGLADPRVRRAAAAEIIAFDNVIVVYKFIGDLHFYATADAEENEIILATVLSALTETVSMLLACVPALCADCTVVTRRRCRTVHLRSTR